SNRLTAEFLADVLVKMAKDADYVSFFPMAGVEGTVKSFLKDTPLEDYIALKTGSMNGIQCYAGYKLDDEYAPTHVVVVMINELPQGRPAAKNAVKKMLIDTFEKQ
ncbi:MAG: D-alanyl-D-alanine carboxypeptidase, partial [Lachnospiraceae bacterium]|nr:D-alanyl-D-alanine carboxypeptidase [Lachnospiraceae bacterium]